MPKPKASSSRAAPVRPLSRPLTRQTFSELCIIARQFSLLPLELARMIVAVTAREHVCLRAGWVARSLALVCKEFRAVVEPILLHSVRITTNTADFFRYNDPWASSRFVKHTQRLVLDGPPFMDVHPALFAGVRAFKGRPRHVDTLVRADVGGRWRPTDVTVQCAGFMSDLEDSTWSALQSLECVARLHLQECAGVHLMLLRNNMPPGVRMLALDPVVSRVAAVEELVTRVYAFLDETATLGRLLVRTAYLNDECAKAVVRALETLAAATCDARIWLDESVQVRGKHGPVRQRIEDEEARGSLWFTGRQLYVDKTSEAA